MSITSEIVTKSETVLMQIFDEHKMELLEKDSDYIIQSVCGSSDHGPLTKQQMAIHNKINPAVHEICDMLKIEGQDTEQKQAILFIIRLMIVMKILFMIELFKNNRNQKLTHKNNIKETLEEMETFGHA